MTRLLLGFVCGIALAACDSAPEAGFTDFSTLSQDTTLLIGSWELVRTANYWDGGRHVMAAPGQEVIELGDDGSFVVYRFGELAHETVYTTEPRCRTDEPLCWVELEIEGWGRQQWGVDAVTFVYSSAYRDGGESVYRRVE